MVLEPDPTRARVRISTEGGALTVVARFDPEGEPWEMRPQPYHLMDPARPIVFVGDEWGTTHAGRARAELLVPSSSGRGG